MDVNLFTEMLRGLNSRDESIKAAAQYCWTNRGSAAEEFIKTVEKETVAAKKEQKRFFFYLLHELLKLSSKEKPYTYVKLIGAKIKAIVQDFAKSVDSYAEANELGRLIDQWSQEQFFVESFIERLREIITPVTKRLLDVLEQSKTEKLNLKYSKTFLMDYSTIQSNESTKQIYQLIVQRNQLQAKLIRFNQEYVKLDLAAPVTPETQLRREQLLRVSEQYKSALIKLVTGYHETYKELAVSCKEELEASNRLNK